jgi:DNA polymerase-3 subunit epsilon
MLAAHAPPYNRRSRFPHRWWWVVLTDEAFPRLSVVRAPRHDRAVGPFRSRADAADTATLLARFTEVRTCTTRLARSALHGPACAEREVSPCPAARDVTADRYAPAAQRAVALIDGLDNTALAAAVQQITALAERRRYQSAARLRDHTVAAVEVLWRGQRLRALAALSELVAAAPDGRGGWQLAVIRYGQLTAAGTAARGVPPLPVVDAIRAGAQVILPRPAPLGGALVEETALIARWLTAPGVRIVRTGANNVDDTAEAPGWVSPLRSAGPWAAWAAAARSARVAAEQALSPIPRLLHGPPSGPHRHQAESDSPAPPQALPRPHRHQPVDSWESELLTEPHPPREQLFGRTAVDRADGASQPVLPRRQPRRAAR